MWMRLCKFKLVGSRIIWQSEFSLLSISSKLILDLVVLQTSENSGNIPSLISEYAKHSVSIWLKFSFWGEFSGQALQRGAPP